MAVNREGEALEVVAEGLGNLVLEEFWSAGEDVEGDEGSLGPGVDGDVAFRDDDDATEAVRRELVKDVGDVSSSEAANGIDKNLAEGRDIL